MDMELMEVWKMVMENNVKNVIKERVKKSRKFSLTVGEGEYPDSLPILFFIL